jgi:hypothetical protein
MDSEWSNFFADVDDIFKQETQAILDQNNAYLIRVDSDLGMAWFGIAEPEFYWPAVIQEILNLCYDFSPVDEGLYSRSFWINIDGRNYDYVPEDIERPYQVFIYNIQPYTRKIEEHGMSIQVPTGVFYLVYNEVKILYSKEINRGYFDIDWDVFRPIYNAPLAAQLPDQRYPGLMVTF